MKHRTLALVTTGGILVVSLLGGLGAPRAEAASAEPVRFGVNNSSLSVLVLTDASKSAGAACTNAGAACATYLENGWQQWVQIPAPGDWMSLSYDVCSAVSWDDKGAVCVNYRGHADISISASGAQLVSLTGVTGELTVGEYGRYDLQIDAPQQFAWPTTVSTYAQMPYRGINLAGAEYDYAFQLPSEDDGAFYASAGMNTIRLPFKWEYLQSTSSDPQHRVDDPATPIDWSAAKASAYGALVQKYLDRGMNVIIDMHNYMRYGSGGAVIGSSTPGAASTEQYAQAWKTIAAKFANNPRVSFDLMNEPHEMSSSLLVANYNAAIAAIRQVADNAVLVEGNGWTGAHSWTDASASTDTDVPAQSNAEALTAQTIHDPKQNVIINVHQYFDANFSGTQPDCVPNQVPSVAGLTAYLQQNGFRAIVSELGGPDTANCASDIAGFIDSLPSEQYVGYTAWAGGEKALGLSTYIGPRADGSVTRTMTEGIQPNLTAP